MSFTIDGHAASKRQALIDWRAAMQPRIGLTLLPVNVFLRGIFFAQTVTAVTAVTLAAEANRRAKSAVTVLLPQLPERYRLRDCYRAAGNTGNT
jgi:hypothetical protein